MLLYVHITLHMGFLVQTIDMYTYNSIRRRTRRSHTAVESHRIVNDSFGLQKAMTHLKLLTLGLFSAHVALYTWIYTSHNNYSKIKTRTISYTVKSILALHMCGN